VLQDVESVASIRARAEQRLDKHQRMMEVLTAALGRPRTVYVTLSIVVGWVAFNLVTPKLFGWQRIDPPPFFWLQGMVTLSALLMTTLVLITANRQTRNAEERSHLDLQVNLLAEHKVAKLIALVEELRRDLPMVRDRIDREADAMQEAVDPNAMIEALAGASEAEPPSQGAGSRKALAAVPRTRRTCGRFFFLAGVGCSFKLMERAHHPGRTHQSSRLVCAATARTYTFLIAGSKAAVARLWDPFRRLGPEKNCRAQHLPRPT